MSDFSRKRAAANPQKTRKPGPKKRARPPGNQPEGDMPANDGEVQASNGAIELIRLRTDFYKDRAQTLTFAALALMVALGACIACIVMLAGRQPETLYIPTREDGTLAKRYPVNREYLTGEELGQWVARAMRKSFTFNYVYYREELTEAQRFFTDRGYERFIEALDQSILPDVLANQVVLQTEPDGAPQITFQGVRGGIYTWQVTASLVMTPSGRNVANRQFKRIVCLTLRREDTLLNRDGVAISNLLMFAPGDNVTCPTN